MLIERPPHQLFRRASRCVAPLLLLMSLGCGKAENAGLGSDLAPTESPRVVPNTDLEPPMAIAECGGQIEPGPAAMRRLSNEEFVRSARDVFKLTAEEATEVGALLLPENESRILTVPGVVSTSHLAKYVDAAQLAAEFAVSTAERRAALTNCELTEAKCQSSFAGTYALRLTRQMPGAYTVEDLLTLASRATPALDPDPYRPAKLIIAGLLSSPRFLFRVENPREVGKLPNWRKLNSFQVATRLSYLIWGTNPDGALTTEAFQDHLAQPAQVAEIARKMLLDARAEEGLGRFVSRWLSIDDALTAPRLPANSPEWTASMKSSSRAETIRFMQDFWKPTGANFWDSLTAPYSYVDANLASLYGLPSPGADLTRIDLPEGVRLGLLTQSGVLTASVPGGSETVAPILRGKYLRERFLCTLPVPSPPDMVPPAPTDPALTVRERLQSHRTDPTCNACHQLLEPVGFGFERYDLIGRYRATGPKGEALTGEGQVVGLSGNPVFAGPVELSNLLKSAPETSDCLAQRALEFAYGRELRPADACAVAQASAALKASQFDLKEMVVAMATSDAFRFTSVPEVAQ